MSRPNSAAEHMKTAEGRAALLEQARARLAGYVHDYELHAAEQPSCSLAPMCVGTRPLIEMGMRMAADPTDPITTLMAAVIMLAEAEMKISGLGAALLAANEQLDRWESAADVLGPVVAT